MLRSGPGQTFNASVRFREVKEPPGWEARRLFGGRATDGRGFGSTHDEAPGAVELCFNPK